MSTCGEPCDGCPNRAEHHLCDACCHEEPDALQKENRELRAEVERLRSLKPIGTYSLDWNHEQERMTVARAAYQRGAEAMREAAASCIGSDTALLQTYRSVLEGRIRDLPVPEDK